MTKKEIFATKNDQDRPAIEIGDDLAEKIKEAEDKLAVLAQIVGRDYGMSVKFGQLGGGSFFNHENNSIILDPAILIEKGYSEAEFVAGHEGGHRAITRSLEQIGLSREKALELYGQLGFGYLVNCIDDCADNSWVAKLFPRFKDSSDAVYANQFKQENAAMITPELAKMIARLGFTPKFISFGSEIIRYWATGHFSSKLDVAVAEALQKCNPSAERAWREIPGEYSGEGVRLAKARIRYKIIFDEIWEEFQKLVKMDIDDEAQKQLAQDLTKNQGSADKIPEDVRNKLKEAIEKALREIAEDKASDNQSDQNENIPWDKLPEELKKIIKEVFDSLPDGLRDKLKLSARQRLEKVEDELSQTMGSKLDPTSSPITHEEVKQSEVAPEMAEISLDGDDEASAKLEDIKLKQNLDKDIELGLGDYEKIYEEVAELADQLFARIQKIFLPQKHPRWQKNKPTGQRINLLKAMQFEADPTLHDQLWERKTIPEKIDYRFTLLVDLSGSMDGQTIQQTFRGVVLLAEVLNRIGIKTQIFGFQDVPILYKDFNQELSPDIRKRLTVMLKEVSNKGEHNQAGYNSDGYCLEEVSRRLDQEKAKDSFLIVFSDGQPAPDPKHSGNKFDLRAVVQTIRWKTKQKLIGVGLGQNTEHVKDYYPTSLPSLDLKKMPEVLAELLADMIKYPNKYK